MAVTGGYAGDPKQLNQQQVKDLKKKRDSNIVWLTENRIYKELIKILKRMQARLVNPFRAI